jgi:hypothetical protein
VVEVISRALPLLTVPNPAQVVPLVEYCQAPSPLVEVIAIPRAAPVSTSAQEADVRIDATWVPVEGVFSLVGVRVTVKPLFSVGASFTAVMVVDSVAVAAAIADEPPLLVVSMPTRDSLPAVDE